MRCLSHGNKTALRLATYRNPRKCLTIMPLTTASKPFSQAKYWIYVFSQPKSSFATIWKTPQCCVESSFPVFPTRESTLHPRTAGLHDIHSRNTGTTGPLPHPSRTLLCICCEPTTGVPNISLTLPKCPHFLSCTLSKITEKTIKKTSTK